MEQCADVIANEIQSFNKRIGDVYTILNEYHINHDTVNTYTTEFESNHRKYTEYERRVTDENSHDDIGECLQRANEISSIINERCSEMLKPFQDILKLLRDTDEILRGHALGAWKRYQILLLYGDSDLPRSSKTIDDLFSLKKLLHDQIQTAFEQQFQLIRFVYELLDKIHLCHSRTHFMDSNEAVLADNLKLMLQNLLLTSFVVCEHPEQVIHKDRKFKASVCVLLVKHITRMSKPLVSILSESQIRQQHTHNMQQEEQQEWLTLLNGKIFDIPYADLAGISLPCDSLDLEFVDLQLGQMEQAPSTDVMDQKYALQFRCAITIQNNPRTFDIWTTSLPITIGLPGKEVDSWATIIWDNSFFSIYRIPFDIPSSVQWSRIKWALRQKFFHQTGCELNESHMQCLYEKIVGLPFVASANDRLIPWHQFAKLKRPQHTFYAWFHEATKLVRLHLTREWKDGLIQGFISKENATRMLKTAKTGTFLLRFSDSTPGGISVALYKRSADTKDVHHMEPYVCKDFEPRSVGASNQPSKTIGDLIKELSDHTHVYPDLKKEKVFYFTPRTAQPNRSGQYYKKIGKVAQMHQINENLNVDLDN